MTNAERLPWITPQLRAEYARRYECAPDEVEARMAARRAAQERMRERAEREGLHWVFPGRERIS